MVMGKKNNNSTAGTTKRHRIGKGAGGGVNGHKNHNKGNVGNNTCKGWGGEGTTINQPYVKGNKARQVPVGQVEAGERRPRSTIINKPVPKPYQYRSNNEPTNWGNVGRWW